jgi:hypothetical protein
MGPHARFAVRSCAPRAAWRRQGAGARQAACSRRLHAGRRAGSGFVIGGALGGGPPVRQRHRHGCGGLGRRHVGPQRAQRGRGADQRNQLWQALRDERRVRATCQPKDKNLRPPLPRRACALPRPRASSGTRPRTSGPRGTPRMSSDDSAGLRCAALSSAAAPSSVAPLPASPRSVSAWFTRTCRKGAVGSDGSTCRPPLRRCAATWEPD